MSIPSSIGFLCMQEEKGEKRVFLPEFIHCLAQKGMKIYLEKGYGKKLGLLFSDYKKNNLKVYEVSREVAFQQDIVMILRAPALGEYKLLKRGGVLISMLHYHTRPKRVRELRELGIKSISLDSIRNQQGIRLVQNMKSVAWNGLRIAFDVLEDKIPNLNKVNGEPIRVAVMGTGMIGKHALDAATKFGSRARNLRLIEEKNAGVIASALGRNITANPEILKKILRETDILVDATQREDASHPIIENAWLAQLRQDAIIVDLCVDPYILDVEPKVVRGIEGIPQGNLDKYIFAPDDPDFCAKIPAEIPTDIRRTSISCYSWPGIRPRRCMQHYDGQLKPLMQVLLAKGYDDLSFEGGYFEQALKRGTLDAFLAKA